MSDVETSATAQQVPKTLFRWRAHFCSKATQWHKTKRHGIKSPRHSSKVCLDTNIHISSIHFPSSLQNFFKYLSTQSIIITVAYQFLKLIRIWLQWELTVFFPELKGKYIQEFFIFPSFSSFRWNNICFNFALTISAVALINLKKQLVLSILIRTSKDN